MATLLRILLFVVAGAAGAGCVAALCILLPSWLAVISSIWAVSFCAMLAIFIHSVSKTAREQKPGPAARRGPSIAGAGKTARDGSKDH